MEQQFEDGKPYTELRAGNGGKRDAHLSWFAAAYNGDTRAHGRKATNDARRPGNAHDWGTRGQGTRSTRVIAVGQEGNDAPLTVTDEIWRSTKYGIVVLTVRDDPRSGTRTEEVTEFQPGEPDPALFQAPKGYTIREHTVVGTK